jgi:hypothetical protein
MRLLYDIFVDGRPVGRVILEWGGCSPILKVPGLTAHLVMDRISPAGERPEIFQVRDC